MPALEIFSLDHVHLPDDFMLRLKEADFPLLTDLYIRGDDNCNISLESIHEIVISGNFPELRDITIDLERNYTIHHVPEPGSDEIPHAATIRDISSRILKRGVQLHFEVICNAWW